MEFETRKEGERPLEADGQKATDEVDDLENGERLDRERIAESKVAGHGKDERKVIVWIGDTTMEIGAEDKRMKSGCGGPF